MVHLRALDSVGHSSDWNVEPGSPYMDTVIKLDGYLGQVFEMIDQSPELAGRTHIILTTDHGGTRGTFSHLNSKIPTNYRIPFYVWGPGVQAGADLYELNPDYHDPGDTSPVILFSESADPKWHGRKSGSRSPRPARHSQLLF